MSSDIDSVLSNPDTSHWLRLALVSALELDPVDAANDAEVLAALLRERCDAALFAGKTVGSLLAALQEELWRDENER